MAVWEGICSGCCGSTVITHCKCSHSFSHLLPSVGCWKLTAELLSRNWPPMKRNGFFKIMFPPYRKLASHSWSMWDLPRRLRSLTQFGKTLKGHSRSEALEECPEVSVVSAMQFNFFLCSIFIILLPDRCILRSSG